jgi:hypothetical protein
MSFRKTEQAFHDFGGGTTVATRCRIAGMLSVALVSWCALAALLMRNRPDVLVLTFAILWIILPQTFVREMQIAYGVHPATILIFFGLAASILTSCHAIRAAWKNSVKDARCLYAALLVFLMLAGLSQVFAENPYYGLRYAMQQVVAPLAAFAIARCALHAGQGFRDRCLSLILFLAAVEAILALIQNAAHQYLPFEAYFRQEYWYVPTWTRYGGSFDHPLILGLFLTIAMWTLWYVPWVTGRLGLAALYLAGISVTESRTALVVSVVGLVAMVAFAPISEPDIGPMGFRLAPLKRLASLIVVAIALLGAWNILLGSDVVQRFISDDSGSTAGRQVAIGIFFEHMKQFLVLGGGSATSKVFAVQHGSEQSFENQFMSYTVDYGLLAALFYFGVQVVIVARSFLQKPEHRDGSRFLSLTALVAVVMTQSFSSQQSASAMLLWLVLALASGPTAGRFLSTRESQASSSAAHVATGVRLSRRPSA